MRIGRLEIKYQGRRYTIDGGWIVKIEWFGPLEWKASKLDEKRLEDPRPVNPASLGTILKP